VNPLPNHIKLFITACISTCLLTACGGNSSSKSENTPPAIATVANVEQTAEQPATLPPAQYFSISGDASLENYMKTTGNPYPLLGDTYPGDAIEILYHPVFGHREYIGEIDNKWYDYSVRLVLKHESNPTKELVLFDLSCGLDSCDFNDVSRFAAKCYWSQDHSISFNCEINSQTNPQIQVDATGFVNQIPLRLLSELEICLDQVPPLGDDLDRVECTRISSNLGTLY